MKKRTDKVSLREIARHAGFSLTTICFALQNRPGVNAGTRQRILRIAKELGYTPDARISDWMTRVRDAKTKDLLPIAWLNTCKEKDAWNYPFHSPYIKGARDRAREFGYKLEEIWCHEPGMTMQRLSRILYQRAIDGVIVTHPARHLRLNWNNLASVALGDSLAAPKLHRVEADFTFNLLLAWKHLRRLGYRRIGICLASVVDTALHHSIGALARDLCLSAPSAERVPPLFYAPSWMKGSDDRNKRKETVAWLKHYKPEVIVGHDNHLEEWVTAAGYRVPEDVAVVHLAVDDDVLDWAGIHSQRQKIGAAAVEWLVALMRNRQFGVPETPFTILIRGVWQTGRTVRALPPAAENGSNVLQKRSRIEKHAAS